MKKIYTILDNVAKDTLAPFVASTDEQAKLMVTNSIKSHQFDRLSLSDCQLVCLAEFDTEKAICTPLNEGICFLDSLVTEDIEQQAFIENVLNELKNVYLESVRKVLEKVQNGK